MNEFKLSPATKQALISSGFGILIVFLLLVQFFMTLGNRALINDIKKKQNENIEQIEDNKVETEKNKEKIQQIQDNRNPNGFNWVNMAR